MHLNMSKFKKLSEDKKSATFLHPDGHKITVAKHVLSPDMKSQLSNMPVHMVDGGQVPSNDELRAEAKSIPPGLGKAEEYQLAQNSNQVQSFPDARPSNEPVQQEQMGPQAPSQEQLYNESVDKKLFSLRQQNYSHASENDLQKQAQDSALSEMYGKKKQEDRNKEISESRKIEAQTNEMEHYNHDLEYIKSQNEKRQAIGLGPLPLPVPPVQASGIQMADSSMDSGGPSYQPITGEAPKSPEMIPQQAPPANDYGYGDYAKNIQGGIDQQSAGMQNQANALGALGKEKEALLQQDIQAKQQIQQDYQQNWEANNQEVQAALSDYKAGHIDPSHYMSSMGTAGKISTAIGLILGGMGGGMLRQGNPALEFLNKQIENDVRSQIQNLDKKNNLVGAYMKQFNNIQDATNMARAVQSNIVADQLEQAAAKSSNPIAQAQAQMAIGQLKQSSAQALHQISMSQSMMKMMGSASGSGGSIGQSIQAARILNPAMAKSMEERYIPGIEALASVPIPQEARSKIIAMNDLAEKTAELEQFAKQYGGSLDPKIIARGKTLAALTQNAFRVASSSGVYKESDAKFIGSFLDENPAAFFGNWRTIPKYREVARTNMNELNRLKGSYGLPTQFVPSSAKTYEGNANAVASKKR